MENSIISISLAFEAAATGQLLCIMEITIMPDMLSSCQSRYLRSEKLFFLPGMEQLWPTKPERQTMLGVSGLLNCNLFLAIFFHFYGPYHVISQLQVVFRGSCVWVCSWSILELHTPPVFIPCINRIDWVETKMLVVDFGKKCDMSWSCGSGVDDLVCYQCFQNKYS